ncbi:MAG: ribonuclease HII [Magnetococcales bacterium]|nr:ribonuclease HII [Magnetococcales bacterium]
MKAPPTSIAACTLEQTYWQQGIVYVCGVDEVGRGPLAGPVIAAAVILDHRDPLHNLAGLNDSKQIAPQQRQQLATAIYNQALAVATGQASVEEIDRLNIRVAALLAMQRAVMALSIAAQQALVDGRDVPDALPCPATAIIGGDGLCASIAAASIVAKVARDQLMAELSQLYPGYGWEHNSGYPTPQHRRALVQLGVTPQHRRSFAPVRQAIRGTDPVTPSTHCQYGPASAPADPPDCSDH